MSVRGNRLTLCRIYQVTQKVVYFVILNIDILCQASFPLFQRFGNYRFSESIDNLTKGHDKIFFELKEWPNISPSQPHVRYDLGFSKGVQENL